MDAVGIKYAQNELHVLIAGPGGKVSAHSQSIVAIPHQNANDAVISDLDADGDADVIVCDQLNAWLTIYLNSGAAPYYGPSSDMTIGLAQAKNVRIELMDANMDGTPDVVVGTYSTGGRLTYVALQSRLGSGLPQFAPAYYLVPSGTDAPTFHIGPSRDTSTARVALYTSATRDLTRVKLQPLGTFPLYTALSGSVPTRTVSSAARALDMDHSGHIDLVFAAGNALYVALSGVTSASTLAPPALLFSLPSSAGTVSSFAAADVTGDAAIDIVLAASGSNDLFVLRGGVSTALPWSHDATTLPTGLPTPAISVETLDANGDGTVDVLAFSASAAVVVPGIPWTSDAAVAWFDSPVVLPLPGGIVLVPGCVVWTADVTGDGLRDLVLLDVAAGDIYVAAATPGSAVAFAPPVVRLAAGATAVGATSFALASMGPGPNAGPDLVWAQASSVYVALSPGGPGSYWLAAVSLGSPSGALLVDLCVVDVTHDGRADVFWVDVLGAAGFWFNNELDMSFDASDVRNVVDTLPTSATLSLVLADFSDDGYLDIAAVTNTSVHVALQTPEFGALVAVPGSRATLTVPECGGVPYTLACLAASLSHISSCTDTYVVGAGLARPFVGCAREQTVLGIVGGGRAVPVSSATHISNAAFDCAARGGGVVFAATATLHLVNVAVHGTTFGLPASSETAGVMSSAALVVTNSSFSHCDTSAASTFQLQAGQGGCIVVNGGSLVLTDTVFTDTDAAFAGGAVALFGASSVTMAGCVFERTRVTGANGIGGGAVYASAVLAVVVRDTAFTAASASSGSGGALYIDGSTVSLALDGVVAEHCTALLGAGGAMAVTSLSLTLDQSGPITLRDCSARWGGAVAVAGTAVPSALEPMALRRAGSSVSALGAAADFIVDGATAAYGGVAFSCGPSWEFGNETDIRGTVAATFGGGIVYHCLDDPQFQAPPALWAAATVTAGYGEVAASQPASAMPASIPSTATAGLGLGKGEVTLRDAYSTLVVDANLLYTVISSSLIDPRALERKGEYVGGAYSLASVALSPLSIADLGVPLSYSLRLKEALADSATEIADLTVTLSACGEGYGRFSADGTPLVCAECLTGTFSPNTSTDPCKVQVTCSGSALAINGECVDCPDNTLRVINGSLDIPPCVCPPGFYTPERRVNTACIACPPGGTCAGALMWPVASPGFYPDDGTSAGVEFSACIVPSACIGGLNCGRHYKVGSYFCT
ncbi:uncharacterized protein AMSG_11600 [Thecamonas trahens ATCC 50062]|uniref:Uncharacterized protein n=1 Tax=Thecamonas trahens ATCC 50062 TaxID=461836 RepID=A0A0L0D8I4_THETB|nr:hypothetical protein AMSG_11600 [Thecamonas trahens ATCC 50062]KNC48550.1 hypothetical protein AMSG_11600 [Thecamonas trahens ATCC 50062]|eukprot:XP_013762871.1 hypothetical protein AMSG_11600 [Thecamonas trahens ATCC 50062]